MPVFRIPADHVFPDPNLADPSGLLGVGGDLDPARVLLAYHLGIFPWFSEGDPYYWWSPDPRVVLDPQTLKVPRSLGKRIRQGRFHVTLDRAFAQVIGHCAAVSRPGQPGTWITPEMERTYLAMHRAGYAHSVEAWEGEALVGGLYGVAVGHLFAGESMFALASDASKVAFVHFVRQWQRWGGQWIDCQMHTDHLARFGAFEVSRHDYLAQLAVLRSQPMRIGTWSFDDDFECDGR